MNPNRLLACIGLILTLGLTSLFGDSIKIATFNIQNYGKTKAGRPATVALLAEIIRKYDIVAVQEISDKSGKAPVVLLDAINDLPNTNYSMLLSERSGQQPNDRTSQEQYAFFFNNDTVRAAGQALLYPDDEVDLFQREPYTAAFETVEGDFSFVLISIHTRPQSAVEEIAALANVFAWAQQIYSTSEDFIALGDFNASCNYARPDELTQLRTSALPYLWIVPDSADSNLAQSECAYDRIVMIDDGEPNYAGNWGVDEAFTDKKISDHWPVWAEFAVE